MSSILLLFKQRSGADDVPVTFSTVSAAVASAVSVALSAIASPGMQFRTGNIGRWQNFASPGCVFHAGPTELIGYDDSHVAITGPMTAHIKVVTAGTSLQVVTGENAWQVRTADLTQWAVVGSSRHVGQTFYSLQRVVVGSIGRQRSEVPQ